MCDDSIPSLCEFATCHSIAYDTLEIKIKHFPLGDPVMNVDVPVCNIHYKEFKNGVYNLEAKYAR